MMSCLNSDYIEIACMYRYPVLVTLKTGGQVHGIAMDTLINEFRQECLKLQSDNTERVIVLSDVHMITIHVSEGNYKEIVLN